MTTKEFRELILDDVTHKMIWFARLEDGWYDKKTGPLSEAVLRETLKIIMENPGYLPYHFCPIAGYDGFSAMQVEYATLKDRIDIEIITDPDKEELQYKYLIVHNEEDLHADTRYEEEPNATRELIMQKIKEFKLLVNKEKMIERYQERKATLLAKGDITDAETY